MTLDLNVDLKIDVRGLKKLSNLINRIDNAAEIGFFNGKAHPKDNGKNTIAEVAMINELGIGVPSRPFMRTTFINNNNYLHLLRGKAAAIVTGKVKTKRALNELGAKVETDIKEMIADNEFQENSRSTVRKKGFDDPLTETGTMERDVDHRVT